MLALKVSSVEGVEVSSASRSKAEEQQPKLDGRQGIQSNQLRGRRHVKPLTLRSQGYVDPYHMANVPITGRSATNSSFGVDYLGT